MKLRKSLARQDVQWCYQLLFPVGRSFHGHTKKKKIQLGPHIQFSNLLPHLVDLPEKDEYDDVSELQ